MHALHWPDPVLTWIVLLLAAGFPLVVALAWIFDVREGRIERTPDAGGPGGAQVAVILASIAALAAAPGLVWYFGFRAPRQSPVAAAPSIAVLPFADMSVQKDQEYFSDGMAEEILNALAQVPGLRVAARTSAFAFKGKNEDTGAIAGKLHVATLLEGSVRKVGDRIRITTQLINAADGYHLWSETYDRKLTDVFAVQDEIARAVVVALKLKLLPGQAPTSKQHRTPNPEVYTQYLLGRQFFNRSTLEGYQRAAQAYQKAIAMEPGFAPAWAGLAHATYWIADWGETRAAVSEGQRRALAAAEKAVALDPELAEAYAARGAIRSAAKWDWEGGKADFERALALNPEDADVHIDYSKWVLRALGHLQEAIASARKATALDPLNARAWSTLGALFTCGRQLKEAHEALNRSLEISPEQAFAPMWLGITLMLEGQPAAALAAFARSTSEHYRLEGAGMAHHDLGHARESQQALDQLLARYSHNGAYQIALVYAWRGEKDRAFEWLDRAYAQRDGGLTILKMDPMLRGLRTDPRFASFLKKLNLPPD